MELHEPGAPIWPSRWRGAYRAAGGDPGSDALLSFFAAYRAEVRAKVALLRAGQRRRRAARADRRTPAAARARDAVALAGPLPRWSSRSPAYRPREVDGRDAPCLGVRIHAAQLRRRAQDLGGARTDDAGAGDRYTRAASRSTYAELGRRAARQMAARRDRRCDVPVPRRSRCLPRGARARRAHALGRAGRARGRAGAPRRGADGRPAACIGCRRRGRARAAARRRAARRGPGGRAPAPAGGSSPAAHRGRDLRRTGRPGEVSVFPSRERGFARWRSPPRHDTMRSCEAPARCGSS